jgi:hypothetical protein
LFEAAELAIDVLKVLAAFCAAENTDEKKPLGDCPGPTVPPGVLASSSVGVSGADIEFDSLLGGFVDERARRCDIMFPEGDTVTFGFGWDEPCLELPTELVGDAGLMSVGVGGVTSVVGASTVFGGVAGICVMIRLGVIDGNVGVECVSLLAYSCGGEA